MTRANRRRTSGVAGPSRSDSTLRELDAMLPGLGRGYARMLDVLSRQKDGLPGATRELIYGLLYAAEGDEVSARRHLAASRAAGLSRQAVAQGVAQLLVVSGMPTWTRLGWRLLRDEQPSGPESGEGQQ